MPASARPACTRGQMRSGGVPMFSRPNATSFATRPKTTWSSGSWKSDGDASRELGRARSPGVAAFDLDPALEAAAVEVRDETGERAQERRLSRARRAEQGDDLAGLDSKRDVRKRRAPSRPGTRS